MYAREIDYRKAIRLPRTQLNISLNSTTEIPDHHLDISSFNLEVNHRIADIPITHDTRTPLSIYIPRMCVVSALTTNRPEEDIGNKLRIALTHTVKELAKAFIMEKIASP
jgi:hypothetical protein